MVANRAFLFVALLLPQLALSFTPVRLHHNSRRDADIRTRRQSSSENIELENEEPLSLMFQRGVVLQRSGNLEQALKEYDLFLKAAQQCQVDAYKYAEVHVNVGAIHLRQKAPQQAKHHFQMALEHRQMATAHVNLAVLALQEASASRNPQTGMECLEKARNHCMDAMGLQDADSQSKAAAAKLIADIDRMLQQAKGQD